MRSVDVKATFPYRFYVGNALLKGAFLVELCKPLNCHLVIITDDVVKLHWGEALLQHLKAFGLTVSLLSFPAGEIHKTRETKAALEDQLFQLQCGRDTCLIALGGGVVLDIVGFIAATYCRGVPVIYLPTTLLAMVDASLGGKTGVNTAYGKNLIGTISSPHSVVADVNMLATLPDAEWKNGCVEMLKHALLKDHSQFEALYQFRYEVNDSLCDVVFENALIKKNIVEQDEKENGIRQLLNLGHTIGHAIETIENYALSHGEAVAIGLLVEGYISTRLGLLKETDLLEIDSLLRKLRLPLKTKAFQNIPRFMETLILDKKSRRKIPRFVLLEGIARPYRIGQHDAHVVEEKIILDALHWAEAYFE